MNPERMEQVISHIDFLVDQLHYLKSMLKIEDGIHFYVVHEDECTSVEIWDSECSDPRIFFSAKEKTPEEQLIPHILVALNTLGIRAHKKKIFWESDFEWSKLPENFRKLDEIYNIFKRVLPLETKEEIKERLNALYFMPK